MTTVAAADGRADHLGDELGASGVEEQRVGAWVVGGRPSPAVAVSRRIVRIRSPVRVPPGSRVRTTVAPSPDEAARSSSAWLVLPDPSGPSSVMKQPRGTGVGRVVTARVYPAVRSCLPDSSAGGRDTNLWAILGEGDPSDGGHVRVPRAARRRFVGASVLALLAVLCVPAVALAHPLGNFTINHYAGLRVVQHGPITLDVVIDEAELPTFTERQRLDTDGDGSVSDEEIEAERLVACQRLAGSLHLTVDGAAETLDAVRGRDLDAAWRGRPVDDADRLRVHGADLGSRPWRDRQLRGLARSPSGSAGARSGSSATARPCRTARRSPPMAGASPADLSVDLGSGRLTHYPASLIAHAAGHDRGHVPGPGRRAPLSPHSSPPDAQPAAGRGPADVGRAHAVGQPDAGRDRIREPPAELGRGGPDPAARLGQRPGRRGPRRDPGSDRRACSRRRT